MSARENIGNVTSYGARISDVFAGKAAFCTSKTDAFQSKDTPFVIKIMFGTVEVLENIYCPRHGVRLMVLIRETKAAFREYGEIHVGHVREECSVRSQKCFVVVLRFVDGHYYGSVQVTCRL
jgi:hypothetical protein